MTADASGDAGPLRDLVARAVIAFRQVHERVFADDPSANANLGVDVVEAAVVGGIATLVLVTPWTLNGLLFPPDGDGPAELLVAGVRRGVVRGDVPPLGPYWSVKLIPDVSRLASPRQARALANSFAGPFHDGVRRWLISRDP